MTTNTTYKKKLIEVSLPLEAINKASTRENYIYRGNPSGLHKWWAQRPLAACRAVLFASIVDDPSENLDLFPTEENQEIERQRLFNLIEKMVVWENINDETLLSSIRKEIKKSTGDEQLTVYDPFSGGCSIPLEAQRLGLNSYASDLNPLAVLISKSLIEIPPKFANSPPVNPKSRIEKHLKMGSWNGVQGLAEDVRYYGKLMRDEAEKRIGNFFPEVEITEKLIQDRPDLQQYIGQKLKVIAWIWARTVKSPNPAFAHVNVPLLTTFLLSTKNGNETYVEPIIENDKYRFNVKKGIPKNVDAKNGTKSGRGAKFRCILSNTPIMPEYIKEESLAGRMGVKLMAVVAESEQGRTYLSPNQEMESIVQKAEIKWKPDVPLPKKALGFSVQLYFNEGTFGDLFTSRQLLTMNTFVDVLEELRFEIKKDALYTGLSDDNIGLDGGGTGAISYAEAVSIYLAFAISKYSLYGNSLVPWYKKEDRPSMLFSRQTLSMIWDFVEVNPFSDIGGTFERSVMIIADILDNLPKNVPPGKAIQQSATDISIQNPAIFSTDPPYYDNIGYANLSDFFYVWLRRSLKSIYPNLFATLSVPKNEELIAEPFRHGGMKAAEQFFLNGMTKAMSQIADNANPNFPITIYYAFRQSENENGVTSSTGWETFLHALIQAGFTVRGTWPIRTERQGRMRDHLSNALASSVILVCRPRPTNAPVITRREFLNQLKEELPEALKHFQHGNIAPVDLAQAAIGPGMAVYTRYSKVIDAEGKAMTVREALSLINQILDEVLEEQEGDFDADSRWALAWFDQYGFDTGEYGVAETLSTAKNTSVSGMVEAGILASKAGKVRLLKPKELPADWDPATDTRLTVWETVHHLIRVLEAGGEIAAAELVAKLGSKADVARELAYRLYTLCERKKRANEALAYNALVQSWPELLRLSKEEIKLPKGQTQLFEER